VSRDGLHAGDALTLGRLVVTPLFVWLFWRALHGAATGWLAGVLFAAVGASDYFDGLLARRAGRASARGRVMDGVADVVFILAALIAAVVAGRAAWWVPASIAASFGYYVIDSWVLTRHEARRSLITSRVGHFGGVCNYVLVGVLTFNDACGIEALGPGLMAILFYAVPVYSAAAIVTRLTSPRGNDPTSQRANEPTR